MRKTLPLLLLAFLLLSCGTPEGTSSLSSLSSEAASSLPSSEGGSSSSSASGSSSESSSVSEAEPVELEPLYVISLEMKSTYGDSFLIKQGDFEILVDAGTTVDASTVKDALAAYVEDDCLDILVLTHLHTDHIGGMTDVSFFDGLSVKTIVDPGLVYDTATAGKYIAMRDELVASGSTYYPIYDILNKEEPGPLWDIEGHDSLAIEFLDTGFVKEPGTSYTGEQNNSSLAFSLIYGETKWLFAGDLSGKYEETLVANISIDDPDCFHDASYSVFKACHHGATDANGKTILDFVDPDLVFTMSGLEKRNRTSSGIVSAQHPYLETLDRFRAYTENVYWSSINGTITFIDDGFNVTMDAAGRSQDYYYDGVIVDREEERLITVFESKYYQALLELS